MTILFLDSTYDITLGLLSDELKWCDLRQFKGAKASAILQPEAHSLLETYKIKVQDIEAIVSVAGPGFYTGLRLSEGFADVFKFFQIPHYAFLTYSIPLLCGYKEGTWVTKAYRGEYFFHRWDEAGYSNQLVSNKEIGNHIKKIETQIFIHSAQALDQLALDLIVDPISTQDLLRKNPKDIFKEVLDKKMISDSFYFRAAEDEFKVSV